MTDIHPALAEHYDGMNTALRERDRLASLTIDLQNELTVAKKQVDYFTSQLNKVTNERDHYMRYSFALTTRINAMQDIWAGMIDLSKQEAGSQLPAQLPKAANIEGNGG